VVKKIGMKRQTEERSVLATDKCSRLDNCGNFPPCQGAFACASLCLPGTSEPGDQKRWIHPKSFAAKTVKIHFAILTMDAVDGTLS
jgi:hypothetical protein